MSIRKEFHIMLCKLIGSRSFFWNMFSTLLSWGLILLLIMDKVPQHNKWIVFYIYLADMIGTKIYLGLMKFEAIKLEASIRK